MPTRNSDGRFRNHNKPTVVSADTLRAQWVEMEAMRLKRNAFSYEAIAEQITQDELVPGQVQAIKSTRRPRRWSGP